MSCPVIAHVIGICNTLPLTHTKVQLEKQAAKVRMASVTWLVVFHDSLRETDLIRVVHDGSLLAVLYQFRSTFLGERNIQELVTEADTRHTNPLAKTNATASLQIPRTTWKKFGELGNG